MKWLLFDGVGQWFLFVAILVAIHWATKTHSLVKRLEQRLYDVEGALKRRGIDPDETDYDDEDEDDLAPR